MEASAPQNWQALKRRPQNQFTVKRLRLTRQLCGAAAVLKSNTIVLTKFLEFNAILLTGYFRATIIFLITMDRNVSEWACGILPLRLG